MNIFSARPILLTLFPLGGNTFFITIPENQGPGKGSSGGDGVTTVQTLPFREWHVSKCHFKGGHRSADNNSRNQAVPAKPLLFLQPSVVQMTHWISCQFSSLGKVKKKNFTLNIYGFSPSWDQNSLREIKHDAFPNNLIWKFLDTPPCLPLSHSKAVITE